MWTGYGILIYREAIPVMAVHPDAYQDREEAIRTAEKLASFYKTHAVVTEWENGRITDPQVAVSTWSP